MKNTNDHDWLWAAAIAVADRRLLIAEQKHAPIGVETDHQRLAWGHGNDIAETLVLRYHDPDAFTARSHKDTPPPKGLPSTWDELGDELWRRLGVELDVETLRPGDFLMVTPYHVHLATDERHPHYDRRVERPITADFIHSLRLMGMNTRPVVVCAHTDLDGEARLYVKAGRKRTRGAWRANREALGEYYFAARRSLEPLAIEAPQLLRWQSTRFWDPETAERVARTDHDHQDRETVLEAAEACGALKKLGHSVLEIADLKECDHQTVSNLLSLLNLAKELQEALQANKLSAKAAYYLARCPTKARQLEIWRQVAELNGAAQLRAIVALLEGKGIPKNIKTRPLAQSKLFRAVELFPETKKGTLLHGVRLGLQLAAGDTTKALAEVPKEDRQQLRELLK